MFKKSSPKGSNHPRKRNSSSSNKGKLISIKSFGSITDDLKMDLSGITRTMSEEEDYFSEQTKKFNELKEIHAQDMTDKILNTNNILKKIKKEKEEDDEFDDIDDDEFDDDGEERGNDDWKDENIIDDNDNNNNDNNDNRNEKKNILNEKSSDEYVDEIQRLHKKISNWKKKFVVLDIENEKLKSHLQLTIQENIRFRKELEKKNTQIEELLTLLEKSEEVEKNEEELL